MRVSLSSSNRSVTLSASTVDQYFTGPVRKRGIENSLVAAGAAALKAAIHT